MAAHDPQEDAAVRRTADIEVPLMTALYGALDRSHAVVEFELDGTVKRANANFLALMGYSAREVVGRHHSQFCIPGTEATAEYKSFWARLRAGEHFGGEYRRMAKDGREVFLQATYNPILDGDGAPVGVVKFATDITEARQRAFEFESQINAIHRSQGVVEFDLAGHVLAANANFLGAVDYTLDEIKGKHHRLFVERREAESPDYRGFWQRLAAGQFESGLYKRIGRDGKHVWLRATYNPVMDATGRVVRIVKFCSDVTRAHVEGAVRESRLSALDNASCVMECDMKGTLTRVNANMARLLGYEPDELVGRNEAAIVFEDDLNSARRQAGWAEVRAGRPVSREIRRRAKDGREVWLHATMVAVASELGELTGVVVQAADITETKRFQVDSLGKIQALDRAQAVIEFDMQGKVLTANDNFLRLMDYRLDDIVGNHHRIFVTAEEAAKSEYAAFWDRLSRGLFESGEYKRVGRGGKEVWIRATYNPVFDGAGKPLKVVKFASDVTQQKLASAEFEAKVAAMDKGQAVIEFDLEGNVLSANRNFLMAMGYTLREIVGHHHSTFCRPEYVTSPEYRDFWLRLAEGEFISGRFHRVGKYNRDVWIQATYNPILDLNGKVMKVVKYAYDVTKEVMLERTIAARTAEMGDSVGDLAQRSAEIAGSTGRAAGDAETSTRAARGGFDALRKSIAAIEAIQSSSSRVAEIVRVMSEIAGQTNLLAFNAAIEAARAGPHGVGFSVVAGEVRKLAERSGQAAQEIAKLIDESVRHVGQGAEISKDVARSFEGVLDAIERTNAGLQSIASAAEAQRVAAGQVSEMIESLAAQAK